MNLSADRSSFPRFSWRFVLLPIDGGSADRSSFPRFSWSIQEISADRKQFPTLQLKISYPDERISKDPDRPSYRSIVEVGGGVFASLKRRSAFPVPDQWGVELAAADFVEMIALRFELQIAPSRQMCVFYFRSRQRAFFLFTDLIHVSSKTHIPKRIHLESNSKIQIQCKSKDKEEINNSNSCFCFLIKRTHLPSVSMCSF